MQSTGDESQNLSLSLASRNEQPLGITESRMLLKTTPERRMTPVRQLLVALLLTLFFVLMIAYCASLSNLPDSKTFLQVDRPFPVVVLVAIVFVYADMRSRKTIAYTMCVLGGLVLCAAADVVFAANDDDNSTAGVIVNLTAKTLFTIGFTLGVGKGAPLRLLLCVPFYAFCGAVIALVYDKVEMHMVLYVIDQFISGTMGWRALALTSGFPGSDRSKLLLYLSVVGAALWLCSETLQTVNAYYSPMSSAIYLVPITYYLALTMLAFSVPRRLTRSDYWLDHFKAVIDGVLVKV